MVRITIFSIKSCPHCNRSKALFQRKNWDYQDISLSEYPEKRTDMLKLADKLTVPQIFFNKLYIGGASDLEELEKQNKLDCTYEQMKNSDDPTEQEYYKPNYPPQEEKLPKNRTEKNIIVGEKQISEFELIKLLNSELKIEDQKNGLSLQKNSFDGKNCVDVLMKKFELKTRQDAVNVGYCLLTNGIFSQVKNKDTFADNYELYRLINHQSPFILNSWRVWKDRIDDPILTLKNCKKMMSDLQSKYSDTEGMIDYSLLIKDDKYFQFEEAVCEFQKIDFEFMSQNYKIAFFCNLYNLMISHAHAKVGTPRTTISKSKYFNYVKYNVGGHILSFNDIENGILRANRKAPYSLTRQFSEKVDQNFHCQNMNLEFILL